MISIVAHTLWTHLRNFGRSAADLVLPEVCLACQGAVVDSQGLCTECLQKLLGLVSLPYCVRCGANGGISGGGPARGPGKVSPAIDPAVAAGRRPQAEPEGCPNCPAVLPRFARMVRLGPYDGPLKGLVRAFKYRRQEALCVYLGAMLASAVRGQCPQETFDVVLVAPAHWRRRLWRGYDQARSLAGVIAKDLKLPLGHELVRVRHTPPQAHLPRTRRLQNIRGAFGVLSPEGVRGARVLLVDDVTTTGATADEATRTLLDAGASRVVLAVIAKAQSPLAYAHAQT